VGLSPAPVIRRDVRCRCLPPVCLLAAALAAGCLPPGAPPAGQQVVADRDAVLAGILPPTADGMVRVLFTRPGPNPEPDNPNTRTSDLYVVSVDAHGGPPSERLLAAATQGVIAGPCMQGQNICYPSDARGRVFVTTSFDPSTGQSVVERIDPVTGDRLDAHNGGYYLSPSGRRLLVYRSDDRGASTGFTLYEADDRMTVVEGMTYGVFIGDDEDLIYLSAQKELTRIPPGGAPEVLATGISGLSFLAPTNALLLLARPTADPAVQAASVFDPVTLQETPFPFSENSPLQNTTVTASPDGRWLLDVSSSLDFTTTTFTFVERATGAVDVFHLPASFGNVVWRPRRAQLWIGSSYTDDPTIWIKTPGGPALSTSGWQFGLTDATNGSRVSGVFTADGAYWFNANFGPVETAAFSEIQLASADDPDGPRLDLVRPDETDLVYWQLADGRILMTTYKSVPARSDIYAFDLATGDARLLGEAGRVTAVGRTRLLATLHVIDNLGDLTAVELASGRSTPLAPEFTVAAYVEPVGADRVAPGAHVAYQFQARFASPYDGIWVATVP